MQISKTANIRLFRRATAYIIFLLRFHSTTPRSRSRPLNFISRGAVNPSSSPLGGHFVLLNFVLFLRPVVTVVAWSVCLSVCIRICLLVLC